MREFVAAVEDLNEDEDGKVQMLDENDQPMFNEDGSPMMDDPHVRFKLDDRMLRAYNPTPGQLMFMMAALGRGQSNESRFASILNIMFESLGPEDKDWFEGRLLTRDKDKILSPKRIEGIFEYLTTEWFARPTQPPSGSASSLPSGGPKSTPRTEEQTSSDSGPTDS